jgi:8-oxo-dGTP diphosphatase
MPVGSICLIRKNGRLLLQERALGRFGGGKWDCPGGKLRPGESSEECIVREVAEETGLRIDGPTYRGSFDVYFGDHEEPDWIVDVFSASRFDGQLQANAEGRLRWFAEDQIPYDRMWASDRCWLPDLLAGRLDGCRFAAAFWFDERAEQLLRHDVTVSEARHYPG